jgi:PTH2 family peptidyl-tRNA hydrolase
MDISDDAPVAGDGPAPTYYWKQAIVLRTDLRMSKGKMVAQGAHASVCAALHADRNARNTWVADGMAKIALKVQSEAELVQVWIRATEAGLPCMIVRDAGRTEIPEGTLTAVGIGPAEGTVINAVVGELRLL